MAADSVGQIGLDLVVNRGDFDRQMSGIQGLAKKAGAALAAAFAVKKIIDFGTSCIKLGSDLAEVQNVVDVTFPQMSKQVDKFAQNAAASFGLSETMAKKYTGTFGAMAKAFGFNEKAAYNMSTTLTGLSGDVASFYNISQDEAFTKLKSVFTGETESLKDLGIVMTQAALDQYALANGYGKTTQAMSEGEKVALRYKFVTSQLSLASGDFIRTSDGWANQIRILKLQFDSLKATIGQGLINVLTPVIKVINLIINKLMSLANAFKAFTELITGKKSSGGGAKAQTAGMDALAESADGASSALGGAAGAAQKAGGAAKKAAKDVKGTSFSIDELNIASNNSGSDDGGSGGAGGAGGGYAGDTFDMGDLPPTDEVGASLSKLAERFEQLKSLFVSGFKIGAGDMSVLKSIQQHLDGIKQSVKDIFLNADVQKAANTFLDAAALNLGKVAGSFVSVGASICDFLFGAIDKYLSKNKDFLANKLISLFDIGTRVSDITGNLATAFADIFSVFRLDSVKDIGASIIEIFGNTALNLGELFLKIKVDAYEKFALPIIENKDKIVTALSGLADFFAPVFGILADSFTYLGQKVLDVYDGIIHPVVMFIANLVSDKVGLILDVFNSWLVPALQHAGEVIQDLRDGPMSKLAEAFDNVIHKISEFVKAVVDGLLHVLDNYLKPFAAWFIQVLAPYITDALNAIIDAFGILISGIVTAVGHILDALGGLIDFIVGIFTGDWEKAWNGIKDFFNGIWEAIKALLSTALDILKSLLDSSMATVKENWESVWDSIKTFVSDLWDSIKAKAVEIFESIRDKLSEIWDSVKTTIEEKWNAIKAWFDGIWQNIKDIFKLDEMLEIGKSVMNKLWEGMKAIWTDITSWLGGIADAVGEAWDTVIDGAKNLFTSNKEEAEDEDDSEPGEKKSSGKSVKGHASGGFPKSGSVFVANENGKSEMVGSWGGKAAVANNPQITQGITAAVQYGMRSSLAPLVSSMADIARRATPPLTMVGSATPSYSGGGMQDMVDRAVSMASSPAGMSEQYLLVMIDLLKKIIELIESMDLTVTIDIREIKKKLIELDKRTGYTLKTT